MKSRNKTYTQKEIEQNISQLSKKLDDMKLQRTNLSKDINNTKKQIEYWETFDLSQYKLL